MMKELRALLPLWAGSAAVLAIAGLVFPQWPMTARMFYGVASISLAALSVGHEYMHGTLTSHLMLPVTRARLLAMKVAALLPLLVSLASLALVVLPAHPRFDNTTAMPRLALTTAVLLAPVLTMLARSPLAGAVFAGGIAAGISEPGAAYFGVEVARWGLLSACAFSLVGGCLTFMRLEAIDHRGNHLALPAWRPTSTEAPPAAPHPVWALVHKEFRLQQMAFVVAAIGAAVAIPWSGGQEGPDVFGAISVINSALLAVLIGSLAGAEERQMQTLGWQLLLPIAAWKQWAVKIAVTVTVALLLCFGVPAILVSGEPLFNSVPIALVLFVLIGSLYIASLCDNVLMAVVISAPTMLIVVMWFFSTFGPSLLGGRLLQPAPGIEFLLSGLALLLVFLTIRFAYDNHRLGRDAVRMRWQLLLMAAIVAVSTLAA